MSFPFALDVGAFCEPPADGGPRRSAQYQLLGLVEHRGESLRCAPAADVLRCTTPLPANLAAHLAQACSRMRSQLPRSATTEAFTQG